MWLAFELHGWLLLLWCCVLSDGSALALMDVGGCLTACEAMNYGSEMDVWNQNPARSLSHSFQ